MPVFIRIILGVICLLSLGATTVYAQTGHPFADNSDFDVCTQSLMRSLDAWDTNLGTIDYRREANNRGFSIKDCANIIKSQKATTASNSDSQSNATGRNTVGSHSRDTNLDVCSQALNHLLSDWEYSGGYRDYVSEAKKRGFTVQQCVHVVAIQDKTVTLAYQAPSRNDNATKNRIFANASNFYVCQQALNSSQRDWDLTIGAEIYVNEAKTRGFTVEKCAKIKTNLDQSVSPALASETQTAQTENTNDIPPSDRRFSKSTNAFVCNQALNYNHKSWDFSGGIRDYVNEAKARGFSIEKCSRIIDTNDKSVSPAINTLSDVPTKNPSYGSMTDEYICGAALDATYEKFYKETYAFAKEALARGLTVDQCRAKMGKKPLDPNYQTSTTTIINTSSQESIQSTSQNTSKSLDPKYAAWSNKNLCQYSLNKSADSFDQSTAAATMLSEVIARGLSLDDCRVTLGQKPLDPNYKTPKQIAEEQQKASDVTVAITMDNQSAQTAVIIDQASQNKLKVAETARIAAEEAANTAQAQLDAIKKKTAEAQKALDQANTDKVAADQAAAEKQADQVIQDKLKAAEAARIIAENSAKAIQAQLDEIKKKATEAQQAADQANADKLAADKVAAEGAKQALSATNLADANAIKTEQDDAKTLLTLVDGYAKQGKVTIDPLALAGKVAALKSSMQGKDAAKIDAAKQELLTLLSADPAYSVYVQAINDAQHQAEQLAIKVAQDRGQSLIKAAEDYVRKNITADGAIALLPVIADVKFNLDANSVTKLSNSNDFLEKKLRDLNVPIPQQVAAADAAKAAQDAAKAADDAKRAADEEAKKREQEQKSKDQSVLSIQVAEATTILNSVSDWASHEKIAIDPLALASAIGKLKTSIKDAKVADISTARSELQALLAKDSGFTAFQKKQSDVGQRAENEALGIQIARANRTHDFLRYFLSKNVTSDSATQIADIIKNLEIELGKPSLPGLTAASDAGQVKIKELKLDKDFANFQPSQVSGTDGADDKTKIKLTNKNSFMLDGAGDDIVVLYNANTDAPHAVVNILGNLAFDANEANFCWYQDKRSANEVARQVLQRINKLGATKITGDQTICDPKSISKYDLIAFERAKFLNNKIDIDLPLVSAVEKDSFKQSFVIKGSDIVAEIQKRELLAQQVEGEILKNLRVGYGAVRIVNNSLVVCAALNDHHDGHLRILDDLTNDIVDELGGKTSLTEMKIDQAFIAAKRGQCGIVYANAADLNVLLSALKRESMTYHMLPIWYDMNEVTQADDKVHAEGAAKLQAEQKTKDQLGEQQKLEEAKGQTADAQRAAKQKQLRNTFGTAAKALSDDEGKQITDATLTLMDCAASASGQAAGASTSTATNSGSFKDCNAAKSFLKSVFPNYFDWYGSRLTDLWALADAHYELYDYGTAKWNDRRIETVFIKYEVKLKNRVLGKYEDRCMVMGWIADNEFSMRRDAIETSCDDAEHYIGDWQKSRAFEQRWVVK